MTALRQRAEAVKKGAFEAEIRLLFFLAKEMAEAGENEGRRSAVREFGLQFRATQAAVRAAEEAAGEMGEPIDWKQRITG